ncbi:MULTISPECIES: fimbrial protein [Klebsiella]|uniref:fimbrial protein n=1 Tax=Klebsiella TaxID=570 RepID=UPI000DD46EEB|nr:MULTISPECIES: fimbrial protein [Klebsiella]MBZ7661750.1 type 1 fimbrial protein [Klebsiella grimontii]
MKISKIASAVVLTMGVASFAAQADQGSGKVTFWGSIIDAPCSIKNGYGDQRIELGQISNTHLNNGGISTPRPFDIELENCSFELDASGDPLFNTVKVTFAGGNVPGDMSMLAITGQAAGAGVRIQDYAGQMLTLLTPSSGRGLGIGDNTLSFSAYLEKISGVTSVTPGDFEAVTNFTLAYE